MPNKQVKQHDAKQVTVSIAGIACEGYAKGDFITIEAAGDDWGDEQGAEGEIVRWATNETRATATLILMASSATNDRLSDLRQKDLDSPNGAGVGNFECRNGSGRSIGKCPAAWIMGLPKKTEGVEAGTVEWKFRLANYKGFIGGNTSIGPS